MMLLTKENKKALPALYSQEEVEDPQAVVKFFGGSKATWYAIEFDGDDTFYGFVVLDIGEPEMGYFSLSELKGVDFPPFGLGIERDMYYTPEPLSVIKERHTQ